MYRAEVVIYPSGQIFFIYLSVLKNPNPSFSKNILSLVIMQYPCYKDVYNTCITT